MTITISYRTLLIVAVVLAIVAVALPTSISWGNGPSTAAASSPRLHYQGRLLEPVSHQPRDDGNYPMSFRIYNQASGGSPLWSETKTVSVQRGVFSTLLGDTTTLTPAVFNGQNLWLGVSVGADPEMTPRQPLAFVPYAVFAGNAAQLDGKDAATFASANHSHSALPQAYGYISEFEPLLRRGSYNVDSVVWNATNLRYEITLTDFYYSIDDITTATIIGGAGSCPAGATIRTSSVSGKLLVYIVDSAGTNIQCSFHFVTFAGQ